MLRNLHRPVWLDSLSADRARSFLGLFLLETMTRSVMVTIIPLAAYRLLKDEQAVSAVYFIVALTGLIVSLSVPVAVHILRRRWVLTCGAFSVLAACACLASGSPSLLVAGMLLQIAGTVAIEITLNLFVMDNIGRRDLSKFEPKRMLLLGGGWTIGPYVGVLLADKVAHWAPFALSALAAVTLVTLFWFLRLRDNPAVAAMKKPPPNPLHFFPKFCRQPRLVLAWLLAMARTSFWLLFFAFGPIYLIQNGFDEQIAGIVGSAGSALLFAIPVYVRFAKANGWRLLLRAGYVIAGGGLIGASLLAGHQWGVLALLMTGAIGASMVDAAGNMPFLRAVHPHQRDEMTGVYMTFRNFSQIATFGTLSSLLAIIPLAPVLGAIGAAIAGMSICAGKLPRRL